MGDKNTGSDRRMMLPYVGGSRGENVKGVVIT